MPSWSGLRRCTPPIGCRPTTQLRHFSHLSGTEVQQDPKSTSISFLKWIGGIITSSTLAFACYSYSSPNYPSLSFSHTSQSLDHHRPNYLFGDAYRRKVFFKYEKRIRMRSPPEKDLYSNKNIDCVPVNNKTSLVSRNCPKPTSFLLDAEFCS
ncbi:hypothetical protein MTR67_026574 [Solanum verrucosum]|uniref:Uncharacterized protein n=1 Tax=Solanum verrucosum TaxID=315347 RepID=A0AAF0TUX8_SOLVR|nr:hypothetical protein MTR67_026574 [Solanum verrucosum]